VDREITFEDEVAAVLDVGNRITAQSTCICSPGAVSKRMIEAAVSLGRSDAAYTFNIV
jgi:hypothetical protein